MSEEQQGQNQQDQGDGLLGGVTDQVGQVAQGAQATAGQAVDQALQQAQQAAGQVTEQAGQAAQETPWAG